MKTWIFTVLLVSLPPSVSMDDVPYREDPCIGAMQVAMEELEDALLPIHFTKHGEWWESYQQFSDAQFEALLDAQELFKATKITCGRH